MTVDFTIHQDDRRLHYQGRNGFGKCTGISFGVIHSQAMKEYEEVK